MAALGNGRQPAKRIMVASEKSVARASCNWPSRPRDIEANGSGKSEFNLQIRVLEEICRIHAPPVVTQRLTVAPAPGAIIRVANCSNKRLQ